MLSLVIWVLCLVQRHVRLHSDDVADRDVFTKIVLVGRDLGGVGGKETDSARLPMVVVVGQVAGPEKQKSLVR